ncbi:MAG: DUF1508 domain-containing protein [Myxococcaceae bacterium]|nr:DUF1508 domain-containing protein [Myxococcaceae bacterium]
MNSFTKTLVAAFALSLTACGVDDAALETSPETDADYQVNDEALSTKGKFETFTGKDGKTYFHLLAGNGEKVLQSQGYATQASALSGIESLKANGTDASKFSLREASDGSWYFVVISAANGEILAASEMYVSQSNATRAMATVATVVKQTVAQGVAVTGNAKFEVFKGLDSKYYFHARALNGEIVLQSQAYTTRTSALNGVVSVNTNGAIASRYTVLPAADGQYYFVLKAANGATIARSETYSTKSNATRAVAGCVELLSSQLAR